MTKKGRHARGFTLIELLMVMTISAVLTTYGLFSLIQYMGVKTLTLERDKIVNFLRTAQERSMDQNEGNQWGVHFDNTSSSNNFYAIFYGNAYSASASREISYLPNNIRFDAPTSSLSLDISFNKLTGFIQSSQKVLIENTSIGGTTAEIDVSLTGIITTH